MTYSTQQLIDILDQELRATWKGERILLSSAQRLDNPIVEKAIDLKKVGKVFAYQDFRRQIHAYQENYQVSGIIWRNCSFAGQSLRYPELHNQLIPVAGDKEILIAYRDKVLNFWYTHTQEMNYWLVANQRRPLSRDSLSHLIEETEWAEIDAARNELYLGLCWGNPQEYQYLWAKPNSGCHRVIAALTEPSAIKV
jgi:hypothetical protein